MAEPCCVLWQNHVVFVAVMFIYPEIRNGDASNVFEQDCFGYVGSLYYHINFETLFNFHEEWPWDFVGIKLNL